jgi:hypothetical protein
LVSIERHALAAIAAELLAVPGHHAPPQSPSTTFRFLEREFKQRVPIIVGNDYLPAAGRVPVQEFTIQEFPVQGPPVQGPPIHDLLRALCCLHFSIHNICEFDAFLVEYGHLATSDVEVIARHAALPKPELRRGRGN